MPSICDRAKRRPVLTAQCILLHLPYRTVFSPRQDFHVRSAPEADVAVPRRCTPIEWTWVAVAARRQLRADRIVAESNNDGEMVEPMVRVVDPNASYKSVHASRGKFTCAEAVLALCADNVANSLLQE